MRLKLDRRGAWPVAAVFALLFNAAAFAQQAPGYLHLNPMVEKLAAGKPVIGISTGDYSMENAHALARADIDFIRLEGEHRPLSFEAIRDFQMATIDKAAFMKKGNLQPNAAVISRFPQFGREPQAWIEKQALDIGLMGLVFNGVDNAEQTLTAIQNMRYPQMKNSPYREPNGLRGYGPFNALWYWGISNAEYMQRADVWPLNPKGDLLAIVMIETLEGLKNVDKIAAVPGVAIIFPGAAYDLSMAMGVTLESPEREAALQVILQACLRHNVACGIATSVQDIPRRLKEGWKYIEVPADAPDAALHAARMATGK